MPYRRLGEPFRGLGRGDRLGSGLGASGGGLNDPYPGVTVYDEFTDTNGTDITAHTPNKSPAGAKFVEYQGNFQITSNRAAWVDNGAGAYALAAVESGLSDCTVSGIAQRNAVGFCGLAFRVVDVNNYLLASISAAGVFYVIRRFGGAAAVVAQTAFSASQNTDYVIEVTLSGTGIIATVDGGNTINTSYANLTGATKHGLYGEIASQFDIFQVV